MNNPSALRQTLKIKQVQALEAAMKNCIPKAQAIKRVEQSECIQFVFIHNFEKQKKISRKTKLKKENIEHSCDYIQQ